MTRTPRQAPPGLKWASRELLIVVVGVLIALGLDSWRQSIAEDRTETAYLESLLEDLDADAAELDRAHRQATTTERAARTVLDVIEGRADGIAADSLALAVEYAGFLYLPSYFPYTFNELVNTGNLRIIRDPRLRREIASYYNFIESEKQWWDRYRSIQAAYTQVAQGTLGPDIRARIMMSEPIEASPEDRRRILVELATRPSVAAALEGMIWLQGRQVRWHANNRRAMERLRDMIVEAIGGRGAGSEAHRDVTQPSVSMSGE